MLARMADTAAAENFHAYKVVALKELAPYERNPRTHSDQQIAQIRASIKEFGFTNPLLIDEAHNIIAGHGRYLAAAAESMREVPAIVITGLTEAKRRALIIADNQLALNAGWNEELLRAEIAAISEADELEVSILGFNDAELARYAGEAARDLEAEWQGMPEFDQPDTTAHQSIILHCRDIAAVQELAKLLQQPITEKTKYLNFPPAERNVSADKRYVSES